MEHLLTQTQLQQYATEGYLVLDRFIPAKVCDLLIKRVKKLIYDFDLTKMKTVFSTKDQRHARDLYFLESGDKIRFFFEEKSLTEQGELKFPKLQSINKIGHALHALDPVFQCFSHMHKLALLMQELGVLNPLLVQSMYICKQPLIGGEVTCHQDSTYLYVKNKPVTGLWFALEDATIDNGCLWAIPGEHHTPTKSRMIRNNNEIEMQYYDKTPWNLDKMTPIPVAKGSLIVLHGNLPHMSKENTSSRSRHAYSLHIMSGKDEFAKDNWLQRPEHMPFTGFV